MQYRVNYILKSNFKLPITQGVPHENDKKWTQNVRINNNNVIYNNLTFENY